MRREIISPAPSSQRIDENAKFRTNKIPNDPIERSLIETLKANNITWDGTDVPSVWSSYAPLLLISGVFLLLFLLMLKRLGGAGSPMAFGRSRGRLYAQEDLGVMFDDVAGIDEAVDEVKEVVDFLKSARQISTLGWTHSKGCVAGRPAGNRQDAVGKSHCG